MFLLKIEVHKIEVQIEVHVPDFVLYLVLYLKKTPLIKELVKIEVHNQVHFENTGMISSVPFYTIISK